MNHQTQAMREILRKRRNKATRKDPNDYQKHLSVHLKSKLFLQVLPLSRSLLAITLVTQNQQTSQMKHILEWKTSMLIFINRLGSNSSTKTIIIILLDIKRALEQTIRRTSAAQAYLCAGMRVDSTLPSLWTLSRKKERWEDSNSVLALISASEIKTRFLFHWRYKSW